MKRILFALCITLFFIVPTLPREFSVAIPVAYDTTKNQWSVLLGLHSDNQWWPFQTDLQKGERANIAAQRALSAGTNGMYNVTVAGVPWEKIGDGFFHIVPVQYNSGKYLYTNARTQDITDFIWVPAQALLQNNKIKPHPKKDNIVGKEFIGTFQSLWPKKVSELTTKPKPASAMMSGMGTQTKPGTTTKISGSKGTQWGGIPNAIYFYVKGQPYYEFTNFYEQDIAIDGKVWPTTEQYYQAIKFTDYQLQEIIRLFKSDASGSGPRKAFDFAQKNKSSVRGDWQQISLDTMRKAVHAKFMQNKDLQQLLLNTGNAVLVEDAGAKDAFYGAGADYMGQNWLGRILMEVRDALRGQTQFKQSTLIVELQKLEQALRQLEATL